jgi:DNA-binding NarL/FixJ family response regulator
MNPTALRRSKILVVHSDPILSAGIVAALRQHADFEVSPEGADAVPHGTAIDVVVADYESAMRLTSGGERAAHRALAAARILALTSNDREADIRGAVEAGVHGYVLLGGPLSELVEAVTAVSHGVRYLGRSAAQRMADSLTRTSLTSRETEVLQLVVNGASNKAIARQLSIEVGTVKSHMTAIMTKLGAASRTQAAAIATTRGLVRERMQAVLPSRAGLMPSGMQLA